MVLLIFSMSSMVSGSMRSKYSLRRARDASARTVLLKRELFNLILLFRRGMDPFDEEILTVLRDGRPRDFLQLLGEIGFSHNTLRLHLNNLVEAGLIIREKMPMKGPGRPKFTYFIPQGIGRHHHLPLWSSTQLVTLPFMRLKFLCYLQKDGRCSEIKELCNSRNCPQILRGE